MCAHEVRPWESKVAEQKSADAEGNGDEVVVELRRGRIPVVVSDLGY